MANFVKLNLIDIKILLSASLMYDMVRFSKAEKPRNNPENSQSIAKIEEDLVKQRDKILSAEHEISLSSEQMKLLQHILEAVLEETEDSEQHLSAHIGRDRNEVTDCLSKMRNPRESE